MRDKRLFASIAAAALVLALAALLLFGGRRPFRALEAGDITAASVRLTPPDVTVDLTPAEITTLAALLREVRVTRRDDSYTEYAGQGVVFALTMADGSGTSIMAYNPFLVIDGVGYRTTYSPCEALSAFGNGLWRASST